MRRILVVFLSLMLLSGCYKSLETSGKSPVPGAIHTSAAETVNARMGSPIPDSLHEHDFPTTTAVENSPLCQQSPLMCGITTQPGESQPPTGSPAASPDPSLVPCDRLSFIIDVNVQDGTEFAPGENFTKIWRLQNTGTCSWTPGYTMVFDDGDQMGGLIAGPFTTKEVPPGETVDVAVELTAPDTPGTYQGFWKLRSPTGQPFGYGEDNQAFWVKINVVVGSGIMYDFNEYADEAIWQAGLLPVDFDDIGEDALPFGPPDKAGEPFAELRTEQRLEGGIPADFVLLTSPAAGKNSYIAGKFPFYTINPGDVLVGKAGFVTNPDGGCGSGEAIFEIHYTVGERLSTRKILWEEEDTCDGKLHEFEIDLSSLVGQEVQFYLLVIASTDSPENYAFWGDMAVKR